MRRVVDAVCRRVQQTQYHCPLQARNRESQSVMHDVWYYGLDHVVLCVSVDGARVRDVVWCDELLLA